MNTVAAMIAQLRENLKKLNEEEKKRGPKK
jgi:hypothetical protein